MLQNGFKITEMNKRRRDSGQQESASDALGCPAKAYGYRAIIYTKWLISPESCYKKRFFKFQKGLLARASGPGY
jgi:hypothetical protein